MSDLKNRVAAVVRDDRSSDQIWPEPNGAGAKGDFDFGVQDWGFVFGAALAIARGEDPYEASDEVGTRAREAALSVYVDYARGPSSTGASLTSEQADLLAKCVTREVALTQENGLNVYDAPATLMETFDTLGGWVALLHQVERREVIDVERATAVTRGQLNRCEEAVTEEQRALPHIRAGDPDWCPHGVTPEEAEQAARQRLADEEAEAATLTEILSALGRASGAA